MHDEAGRRFLNVTNHLTLIRFVGPIDMAASIHAKAFSCSNTRAPAGRRMAVKVSAHVEADAGKRSFLQQAGCTFLAATIASSSVLPALAVDYGSIASWHPQSGVVLPALAVDYGSTANRNGLLCDADCVTALESKEMVTTQSGLQYKDIIVGRGPAPSTGLHVLTNYVAMTSEGRIFDNSLDKGKPYDIKVGSGQVVAGLDEGLRSMKPGGLRRLYIPVSLAFPNGLKAAPGRPVMPRGSDAPSSKVCNRDATDAQKSVTETQ
eukprot:gene30504-35524_t